MILLSAFPFAIKPQDADIYLKMNHTQLYAYSLPFQFHGQRALTNQYGTFLIWELALWFAQGISNKISRLVYV